MSGPNTEVIRTADQEDVPDTTVSAKDLQSRVEGDALVLDDGEEVVRISAEIGPRPVARERLRILAVNALALAEGLK